MSVKMKFGSKDIPFVYKGDKLVYPNPIKDGLLLWYDFKGMRNTDTNKEVAKDLSGNGNDGTLTNFNFTEGSGYKDNTLVFDGVDDSLTIPELVLDETAMTVVHDGNIYSYEDDKVLTLGEDGEIVGSGKNLLPSFYDGAWLKRQSVFAISPYHLRSAKGVSQAIIATIVLDVKPNTDYTIFVNSDLGRTRISGDSGSIMGYQSGDFSRVFNTGANESVEVELGVFSGNVGEEINFSNVLLCQGRLTQLSFTPAPKDYKTTTLTPTSLTDLQLYNKTLRKEELLHNAESKGLKKLKPGVVVQDGLVLHYDFSHESNTSEYKDKAFDYSGSGNHGVLTNFAYSDYSGYQNGGLEFDGVDDEVVIPYENNMFSVDFAWSAVIKPYTVDKDMMFMYGSTTAQYFRIQNGKLGASVRGQDSPVAYALTNFALDANTAYHVVLSHTNGDFKIYANGEQVGESDRGMRNEKYRLSWLGKYTSADPRAFEGAILSVQVHNKALSAEEIAHNYAVEKEKFNIVEGEI